LTGSAGVRGFGQKSGLLQRMTKFSATGFAQKYRGEGVRIFVPINNIAKELDGKKRGILRPFRHLNASIAAPAETGSQSRGHHLDDRLAVSRRPYRAPSHRWSALPALNRWESQHCASGAIETGTNPVNRLASCDCAEETGDSSSDGRPFVMPLWGETGK